MFDHPVIQYSLLIPLLPLIGAVIAGFFGARWLKGNSHWPIWIGVGISALLSIWLMFSMLGASHHAEGSTISAVKNCFTWIEAGNFKANWGYFFDPLTAVMLCVVCGIGFLITVFAAGYMKGEQGYFRFFAYLGLFIFMMTNLVMGENLIMLYLGWEGVGLCSYLLIGYYYDKPAAREAAKKAFLVNRVGDFGFALGIMLTFLAFGTTSYFGAGAQTNTGFLEMAMRHPSEMSSTQQMAMHAVPFLLMLGAFGKSAQFPLYVWLPDAMEGPTPVSALIHAATMVTAGVYMIARCAVMFFHWGPNGAPYSAPLITVAVVGAFTALFAASIAMRQFDLKKVFAYSTVSQLGFMFVGVGVLAPVAGVFHLVTHAFFKALLFLSSGVVMHAMAGELDMRKMSGLKRVLPKTRWLMLIGCLALAGVPPLSGFFSKDEVVAAAFEHNAILGIVLLFTAFLTAYYTFRLYFRVFEGPEVIPAPPPGKPGVDDPHGTSPEHVSQDDSVDPHLIHDSRHHGKAAHDTHGTGHGDHHHHDHEPAMMMVPLYILAIGAVLSGIVLFQGERLGHFLSASPSIRSAFVKASGIYLGTGVAPSAFGLHEEDSDVRERLERFHWIMMVVSSVVSLAGIWLAYILHLKNRRKAEQLAASVPGLVNAIDHRYWIDEIYQAVIVEPLRALGRLLAFFDRFFIDGIVNSVGIIAQLFGVVLRLFTQRGYLQGYALTMLLGIAIILILVFM
ncbi:MAG: NADH-quinone oxidoreductase subunit L [Anaerolineae bacterium]|nr:NADH-quinone oxidoreductase subunit L [Phycisphaerae bacterium]